MSQIKASEKTKIKTKSDKINKRNTQIKTFKIGLLVIAVALVVIYFLLDIFYSDGGFTVILDQDFARRAGLIMYERPDTKEIRSILSAPTPEVMDNISIYWLPENLKDYIGGSHNGDNYVAYTFYLENQGTETHYWYSIIVDAALRNVDTAVRVWVFHNGEGTLYAKEARNGQPEPGTEPFYSDEFIMMKQRERMQPGDIDKFTVVIWVEGDDPDCTDEIVGGEMKMHMQITEEKIITNR